jgi:hypothetical protein
MIETLPRDAKSSSMCRYAHPLAIDLGFVCGLLAAAAVPLILLRGSPWLHNSVVLCAVMAAGIGWIGFWSWTMRPAAGADTVRGMAATAATAYEWARRLATVGLLLAFTIVAYFLPMRLNFWGGYDDFAYLVHDAAFLWSDVWDGFLGRPLDGASAFAARLLTPNRVDGVLYVAIGISFANAVLLMTLLRRLLPGAGPIAVTAAVLYIVNRSDSLVYYVAWAANFYCQGMFWFLLALCLFLISHGNGRRWLLAVACLSLAAALLTNETLFPLALLGPVLIYCQSRDRYRLIVWSIVWFGTMGVLALRFAQWFLTPGSYQSWVLSHTKPGDIPRHAVELLTAIGSYVVGPISLPDHLYWWLLGCGLALAILAIGNRTSPSLGARPYLLAVSLAAAANILAILPFLPIGGTARTEFFAVPAQAVMLSVCLALPGFWLPRAAARFVIVAGGTLLVATATAQSWRHQETNLSPVRFEKLVHIFEQVHSISPHLPAKVLVLFVPDDSARLLLGVDYHAFELSRMVLGVPAIQLNPVNSMIPVTLGQEEISANSRLYRYEEVVAFRLSADAKVALLDSLPTRLLPEGAGKNYAPLTLLQAGVIDTMRFMRYMSWSERPRDVFDPGSGIIFGDGWHDQIDAGGQVGRCADNGAEVIINPAGKERVLLRFDIEPAPALAHRAERLSVTADNGEVLASTELHNVREAVSLSLAVDPDRVVRLHLLLSRHGDGHDAPLPGLFLALRPDHLPAASWQKARQVVAENAAASCEP